MVQTEPSRLAEEIRFGDLRHADSKKRQGRRSCPIFLQRFRCHHQDRPLNTIRRTRQAQAWLLELKKLNVKLWGQLDLQLSIPLRRRASLLGRSLQNRLANCMTKEK